MDWQPHPGFGQLDLARDGETPDWWNEFCYWPTVPAYFAPEWVTGTVQVGPRTGQPWGFWSETDVRWSLDEQVTLAEIEECVAEDPEHDWRLHILGPMGGVVYQRQGCAQWVAVERLDGFA